MNGTDLFKKFPWFTNKELQTEILKNAILFTANKGIDIIRQGQYIKVLPLVVSGCVRVYQESNDGDKEILLYYVNGGETCMESLAACFFQTKSPSKAIADEKTVILNIPLKFVVLWQQQYPEWNLFTLKTFHNRYHQLLDAFNDVAFNKVELRLLKYLNTTQKRNNSVVLKLTHLALANELGTTRVVVSRILKMLEDKGKLQLLRGGIKLTL
jgi:CRP/FNR family transcriptional regulator, anaerobic regulatory protein